MAGSGLRLGHRRLGGRLHETSGKRSLPAPLQTLSGGGAAHENPGGGLRPAHPTGDRLDGGRRHPRWRFQRGGSRRRPVAALCLLRLLLHAGLPKDGLSYQPGHGHSSAPRPLRSHWPPVIPRLGRLWRPIAHHPHHQRREPAPAGGGHAHPPGDPMAGLGGGVAGVRPGHRPAFGFDLLHLSAAHPGHLLRGDEKVHSLLRFHAAKARRHWTHRARGIGRHPSDPRLFSRRFRASPL